MKLLLPVDGSTASINAAKKAFEIAKKDGYSIKMIFVIKTDDFQAFKRNAKMLQQLDGTLMDKNNKLIDDEEAFKRMRWEAYNMMDSILSEADPGLVPVQKEVLLGEPFEIILKAAKEESFDLIVMGNRGFSKIKRFFVGSVTQKVISDAPCPVLVIHADAE